MGRDKKRENAHTTGGWRYIYGNQSGSERDEVGDCSCDLAPSGAHRHVSRFPSQPSISQQETRPKKNDSPGKVKETGLVADASTTHFRGADMSEKLANIKEKK